MTVESNRSINKSSEYAPISVLSFGSIVTSKENPEELFLILDTKGLENIHGSLLHLDKNGKEYIIAGGGGTMSASDFSFFVRQLNFDQAMEIVERGWQMDFNKPLPEDLIHHFKIVSQLAPVRID